MDKTLIIISPGFPANLDDTTCLRSQQLFVKLTRELFPHVKIIVVALHYPCSDKAYDWNGAQILPLNGKRFGRIFRPLLWWRALALLKTIHRDTEIAGVLSFWCNETALIGARFCKSKNLTHKIWICGQDAKGENAFVKWIKPTSESLVAMSDFLRNTFQTNHGIAPANTIYNGVISSYTSTNRDIDLIAVGSLIPLKRFDAFIHVIAELKRSFPKLKALLVGKGPADEQLTHLIKENALENMVERVGEISHPDLMLLMNRSKILIHPSSFEGYSTVCLEALAAGCHVVSFTKAEERSVKHWHIVEDMEAMIEKTKELLTHNSDYDPAVVHDMKTTVKEMLGLFRLT